MSRKLSESRKSKEYLKNKYGYKEEPYTIVCIDSTDIKKSMYVDLLNNYAIDGKKKCSKRPLVTTTINSDKLNILKSDNEVIYYIVDKDLIIFYSLGFYNKKVLFELRDIAFRMSDDKNKRVSIGYLYCIPIEQRPYESISQQIEIISFKNCEEISERTYPTPHFTFYDLFELTLATTEEYDVKKHIRKKEKLNLSFTRDLKDEKN